MFLVLARNPFSVFLALPQGEDGHEFKRDSFVENGAISAFGEKIGTGICQVLFGSEHMKVRTAVVGIALAISAIAISHAAPTYKSFKGANGTCYQTCTEALKAVPGTQAVIGYANVGCGGASGTVSKQQCR